MIKTRDQRIAYMAMAGLKYHFAFPTQKNKQPEFIEKMVCQYYNEDYYTIRTTSRKRRLVICRQVVMFLLRKYTELTLTEIGSSFERDHTTVLYSCQTVQDLIDTDEQTRKDVWTIETKIIEMQ